MRRGRSVRGFTPIELMIAVAVVGVLAGVAEPGFEAQRLHKARPTDAAVSMMQMLSAQERFRGHGASYGTLAAIGAPSLSPAGHRALPSTALGADGYERLATATGAQARDTACRQPNLSVLGANLVFAPGTEGSVANAHGANRKCWNL